MIPGVDPPERCGVWIQIGTYETVCQRWDGHEGPCLPMRSELMKQIAYLDSESQTISDAVIAADALNGAWPS